MKIIGVIGVVCMAMTSLQAKELSADPSKSLKESFSQKPLYSYDFSDAEQLSDWHLEGFGMAKVEDGKLILEPEFFEPMIKLRREGKFSNENAAKEYGEYVKELAKDKYPEIVPTMYVDGVFRGGHFNFWNKKDTPDDFAISFKFKALSEEALHMIMFSAKGLKGEDVLRGGLKPRVGIAQEIMFGDLKQYRISYFFPFRKTANMRKAPGRKMTTQGRDIASEHPEKEHEMVVTKFGGEIDYFVNGEHALHFSDNDSFGGGNWGFRLMTLAKGAYDDVTVYELTENPVEN